MAGVPNQSHGGKLAQAGVFWRQFISKNGWAGDAVFDAGGGTSSAVIVADVPWGSLVPAINAAVGYSKANGIAIHRMTPMRHPIFTWLFCMRVTGLQGLGPNGIVKGPSGDYQSYKVARLTLQFNAPPYAIVEDNTYPPELEWRRYTEIHEKPAGEYIATDARMKFNPAFSIIGGASTFSGKVGLLVVKARVQVIHHQVPVRGHLNEKGRPNNILNGLGRVNSDAIMGYPPGTLLMEAPDVRPFGCPLSPDLIGPNPSHYMTVCHNWLFMDPPRGNYDGGPDYKFRGHNLKPQRVDGNWYPVTMEDGVTPQFKPYRFSKVFEMCNDDT